MKRVKKDVKALLWLQSLLTRVNLTVTCSQQHVIRTKYNHKLPGVSKVMSSTGYLAEDKEKL
jgi:hypothetical protein